MEEFFKRIDTSKVAPFLMEKLHKLVETCHAQGHDFYAISGYRDGAEQERLYSIGRTTHLEQKPVTRAKPYSSFHNFGLAVDLALDQALTKDKFVPDWKFEHYKILADEALKLGLAPGYYWTGFPEGPHVQTPFVAMSAANMKALLDKSDMTTVWNTIYDRLKTQNPTKKYWI